MSTVVISQPMYFPWVGMHEQMRLADDYVDYSDVAFSKGSFTNRVQIKSPNGIVWLTVPLRELRLGHPISEVQIDDRQNWRRRHRATLAQSYARAPFVKEMLELVDSVFDTSDHQLASLGLASMKVVHTYFGFDRPTRFHFSSNMNIAGSGSERVLEIVKSLGGNHYVTGHGARNYLDHQAFENAGVAVGYLNYQKKQYPQLHGEFTPFVSSLDLVANCGRSGVEYVVSQAESWRSFL